MNRNPLNTECDAMITIHNNPPFNFLAEPYASMDARTLLSHFQSRNTVRHFPVSKGSKDDVKKADQIVKNGFTLNNESHCLVNNFDWKINPSLDIEWLILLHKFYFANDLGKAYAYSGNEKYAVKWVQLISSWIQNVPEGFINSQVTGRRLQQWLLSYRYFISQKISPALRPDFLIAFLRSIYLQTRYLTRNLTKAGNHRTIELHAIFMVATLFPELSNADDFLLFSIDEILNNMRQDLLSDGVQRELSPDYHHTVLKNYLRIKELALLNEILLPIECDQLIQRALVFSLYVHKPSGFIPAVSDGDRNSYLSLFKKGIEYYRDPYLLYALTKGKEGRPPPCRSKSFNESGYYILRSDWTKKPYEEGLYLFFDCGPLGEGTHGHYDILNFELTAYGHDLIVDPGRYTYSETHHEEVNWRKIFKGTAYHNTVLIDGKDQTAYRKGIPTTPPARPVLKEFTTGKGFDFVSGSAISHEYDVVHERNIFFLASEYWIVSDRLVAEGTHDYILNFHLSPRAFDQTKLSKSETTTRILSPNLVIAQPKIDGIRSTIKPGFVSTKYGEKQKAPIVSFSRHSLGPTHFCSVLYPHRSEAPKIKVMEIPVYHQGTLCSKAEVTALKITIAKEKTTYDDYFCLAHGINLKEYAIGEITYKGKLLFFRKNRQNDIVNLQANRLNFMRERNQVVFDFERHHGRVSFQNNVLHADTDTPTFKANLAGVQKIIRNPSAQFKTMDSNHEAD